ncbi:MAG: LLM class F420-dependent oxidoreductase [Acidimicrobiia bacterium]
MDVGYFMSYWGRGPGNKLELAEEADRLGYSTVWSAEAYGSDAATVLGWLAGRTERIRLASGVFQMPARTPAMAAMTTITLDHLSGGRFMLGLGVSGPQVVEGWHGEPYGKPLGRTREYVSIVRSILERSEPVTHQGDHYQLPYAGDGALGLGKPLKSITHPLRSDVPIFLASLGHQNVALTAEIADGWLPTFWSPSQAAAIWGDDLAAGFERSGDAGKRDRFRIVPMVPTVIDDDLDAARNAAKPGLALYVGGMGAKGKNFYHDLAARYGYEEAADTIQDLWLDGRQGEAVAAVPDDLVDEVCLVGPKERVAERLGGWRDAGADELACVIQDVGTLRALAEVAW